MLPHHNSILEGVAYADLLDHLRRDLNLDPATGLLHATAGGRNNLGFAVGKVTLTWAASTNSNSVVVKHGLQFTPTIVIAGALNAPAFGNVPLCNPQSFTSTQFTVNAEVKTAFTGTVSIVWLAVE